MIVAVQNKYMVFAWWMYSLANSMVSS